MTHRYRSKPFRVLKGSRLVVVSGADKPLKGYRPGLMAARALHRASHRALSNGKKYTSLELV